MSSDNRMLTERQETILDFVREYQAAQTVPPSTREVARRFGCSQQAATKHLQALARKEQLEKLADEKMGPARPGACRRS